MSRTLERVLPPVLMLALLLFLFQVNTWLGLVPEYLLPSPAQVAAAFGQEDVGFGSAFLESLTNAMTGFAMSVALGVSIALLLSFSPRLERAFLPVSVFFQTVPIIAIAPLLVIWFGFGAPTVRASAFVVSFFPILAGTLAGLSSAPPTRLELFRALKATRLQTLWHLKIPQALPAFFTGLEIAVGLAVIGAVVGEFVAGSGLGSLIDVARTQQRVDLVFAAVLLITLMGVAVLGAVKTLKWMLFRYRPFALATEDS
ncbi:MAG: ABC transporter permease [Bdellovibrionaceae bacterium]|nr:ABC transporter permease [Pseudobdellovibrionaceae bacterium]